MREIDKKINKFVASRPESLGVFGYGSEVINQRKGNDKVKSSQIDLIFLVEDLAKWQNENIECNPHDYSLLGKIYLNNSSIERAKGKNKIIYHSGAQIDDKTYKYGVMEKNDFVADLCTWDSFFVAGRFQKPIMTIKSDDQIDDAIFQNRENALMLACLMLPRITNLYDLFCKICELSYIGDIRMRFAEDPLKVKNIVSGAYYSFSKIYGNNCEFLDIQNDLLVYIDHNYILEHLNTLPVLIRKYLNSHMVDIKNVEAIRCSVEECLRKKNQRESASQVVKGLETNGVCRSVPYVLSKVGKRYNK